METKNNLYLSTDLFTININRRLMSHLHDNDKKQFKSRAAANSPHFQQEGIASFMPPPFKVTADPVSQKKDAEEEEKALQKKEPTNTSDTNRPSPNENILVTLQRKHNAYRPEPKQYKPYQLPGQKKEPFQFKHPAQQKNDAAVIQRVPDLSEEQIQAATSHNQFMFTEAAAIQSIQGAIGTAQSGEFDEAAVLAIATYQETNNITRQDGKIDYATLDHVVRALIGNGQRDTVITIISDFFNLGELPVQIRLTTNAAVENEEEENVENHVLNDAAFADGLTSLSTALDQALGQGTSINNQAMDVILAENNQARQTAMWSNAGNDETEAGLAVMVRENFPSEENLARYLAREDVTNDQKITTIGQIQVEIGRLEFLMGVLYLGGNDQSWENLPTANNNRGTFVNYFKSKVGNGANRQGNGQPWCTMFAGYLKRMTGFEEDLSTGGPLVFNAGIRFDRWSTDGQNYLTGTDDFSDPSDFENYSGASIDRNEWVALRQNVNADGNTVEQKEQAIDDFFEDRIVPQAGDVVIINTSSTTNNYSGTSSHTVTVESYNNYTISTIEGNRGQRLTGVTIDLRNATEITDIICLSRIGTEFYTENEAPPAQPEAEGQQANVVNANDILRPLRHMARNLQLMADQRNYIGNNNANASVADMAGAVGNGTQ